MDTCELVVLLPFHIVNQYLSDAIASCLRALPPNSKVVAINTISNERLLHGYGDSLSEINFPKANYLEALNFGLEHSSSKYVAIMNSDDLISENRFKEQITALKIGNYDLSVTKFQKFSSNKRKIPSILGDEPDGLYLELLLLGSYYANATWCFLRTWAGSMRLFQIDSDVSDWASAIRVMKLARVHYSPQYLYFYRMHNDQVTRSSKQREKSFYIVWNQMNKAIGLPDLSYSQINQIHNPSLSSFRPVDPAILSWIGKLEKIVISKASEEDINKIRTLFARRRLLLNIFSKSVYIRFRDLRYLPCLLMDAVIAGKNKRKN